MKMKSHCTVPTNQRKKKVDLFHVLIEYRWTTLFICLILQRMLTRNVRPYNLKNKDKSILSINSFLPHLVLSRMGFVCQAFGRVTVFFEKTKQKKKPKKNVKNHR